MFEKVGEFMNNTILYLAKDVPKSFERKGASGYHTIVFDKDIYSGRQVRFAEKSKGVCEIRPLVSITSASKYKSYIGKRIGMYRHTKADTQANISVLFIDDTYMYVRLNNGSIVVETEEGMINPTLEKRTPEFDEKDVVWWTIDDLFKNRKYLNVVKEKLPYDILFNYSIGFLNDKAKLDKSAIFIQYMAEEDEDLSCGRYAKLLTDFRQTCKRSSATDKDADDFEEDVEDVEDEENEDN